MLSSELDGSKEHARLNKLFVKREGIKRELRKVEKEIFKYETLFLETSQGMPITKSLDYYSSNKVERKKCSIKDTDRIFSRGLPPIGE